MERGDGWKAWVNAVLTLMVGALFTVLFNENQRRLEKLEEKIDVVISEQAKVRIDLEKYRNNKR